MAGEEKGIQDAFLDFCAEKAAEAVQYGFRQEAREFFEAIGLFMVVHFRMVDMLSRSGVNVWRDLYAGPALSPVWATQVTLLGKPGGDETERRVALAVKEWIERECPEAVENGQELVDERGPAHPTVMA